MANEESTRISQLVKRRLGVEKADYISLAVELGIIPRRALDRKTQRSTDRDKAKKVDNWLRSENAPQFKDTMNMLCRAGLLQPEAEAAWRGITPEQAELDVVARRAVIEEREAAERLDGDEEPPQDGLKSA